VAAMFIAEKGPGFTVSRKLEKIGTHNAARAQKIIIARQLVERNRI
jgi:hypothetical protein